MRIHDFVETVDLDFEEADQDIYLHEDGTVHVSVHRLSPKTFHDISDRMDVSWRHAREGTDQWLCARFDLSNNVEVSLHTEHKESYEELCI